jgi:hypothetical protein
VRPASRGRGTGKGQPRRQVLQQPRNCGSRNTACQPHHSVILVMAQQVQHLPAGLLSQPPVFHVSCCMMNSRAKLFPLLLTEAKAQLSIPADEHDLPSQCSSGCVFLPPSFHVAKQATKQRVSG